MTDLEWLAVVLVATLVLESVVRLPSGSSAVLDRGAGRGVWRKAARWSEFAKRGFLLAPVTPPLWTLIRAHPWPVTLSPAGVLGGSVETEAAVGGVLSWPTVADAWSDGPWLHLTDEVRVGAGSPRRADWWADRLSELADLSDDERAEALHALMAAAFDRDALGTELERLRSARRPLTVLAHLSWALFVALLLLIVLPRVGLVLPLEVAVLTGLGLALCLLLLHVGLVVLFHLALPRVTGGAVRGHGSRTLLLAVSPLGGVHATTALARDVALAFHPVTVVGATCRTDQAVECARRHLLRLRHPPRRRLPEGAAARSVDDWYRSRLRSLVEEHVDEHLGGVEDLVAPPTSVDESCRSYCPHCRATFTRDEGLCSDCEIELVGIQRSEDTRSAGP